jgi:hypothetical protein
MLAAMRDLIFFSFTIPPLNFFLPVYSEIGFVSDLGEWVTPPIPSSGEHLIF